MTNNADVNAPEHVLLCTPEGISQELKLGNEGIVASGAPFLVSLAHLALEQLTHLSLAASPLRRTAMVSPSLR